MEWNEDIIARLRTLWTEGLSTAEIGRRLGVSKNAVVGKAHRLDLPSRPSPIRRDGSGSASRSSVRRVAGPTLPPLPSVERMPGAEKLPAPAVVRRPPAGDRSGPSPAALPAMAVVSSRVAPVSRPYGRTVACCWPLGEPGTRGFRFCDEGSVPGKPYCAEHAQIAYVKIRDRREDAA